MDNNKKRAPWDGSLGRLSCEASGAVDTNITTTTMLPVASGQSIFLSGNAPAARFGGLSDVFLTICDGDDEDMDSNESQEYFAIDSSALAQIKQEHAHQEAFNSAPLPPPPLQYRIISQQQQRLPPPAECVSPVSVPSPTTTMQLPSGCEIYLVKEYVDTSTGTTTTTTSPTTIKIEPNVCSGNGGDAAKSTTAAASSQATLAGTAAAMEDGGNGNRKRSYILEAYKKRDDKRRATHNEVERRRRDKINSWIFKLKEMLPAELPNSPTVVTTTTTKSFSHLNSNNASTSNITTVTNNNNNGNTNSRTPPSDSKSQILIKACEYIKAMQEEMKSLRECLSENERLRLSNQRLQNELLKLRNERSNNYANISAANKINSNVISNISSRSNGNLQVTINSLNSRSSNGSSLFGTIPATATPIGNGNNDVSSSSHTAPTVAVTSVAPYAKRELIIRDYVD